MFKQKLTHHEIFTIIVLLIMVLGTAFIYFDSDRIDKKPENKKTVVNNKEIPGFKDYRFVYTLDIDIPTPLKTFSLKFDLPHDVEGKQYLTVNNISPTPTNTYNDGDKTIAEWSWENLDPGKIKIIIDESAKLKTYNIKAAKILNTNKDKEDDLSKYLVSEKLIESNDPYIKSIANQIKGNTTEEYAQNAYEYIQQHITYKLIHPDISAIKALQRGYGKCAEFSNVMMALLRAKGIPARSVHGYYAKTSEVGHAWVEIYYDKYGWVTYDPTFKSTTSIYQNGKFLRNEPNYNTSPDVNYIIWDRMDIDLHYQWDDSKKFKAPTHKESFVVY